MRCTHAARPQRRCNVTILRYLAMLVVLGLVGNSDAVAQVSSLPGEPDVATFQPRVIRDVVLTGPSDKGYLWTTVYGPAWDGVNRGLWLVTWRNRPGTSAGKTTADLMALLIDPQTGKITKEIRLLDWQEWKKVRRPQKPILLGHDGVGLWLELPEWREANGPGKWVRILRRFRTAPPLPKKFKRRGFTLPEDMPERIDLEQLRTASQLPALSLFERFDLRDTHLHAPTYEVWQQYLDCGIQVRCGLIRDVRRLYEGPRFACFFRPERQSVCLAFLPLRKIREPAARKDGHCLRNELGSSATKLPVSNWPEGCRPDGALTWDGEHLWTLAMEKLDYPRFRRHLVCIDLGIGRKPDTTRRYKQVLQYEKEYGVRHAEGDSALRAADRVRPGRRGDPQPPGMGAREPAERKVSRSPARPATGQVVPGLAALERQHPGHGGRMLLPARQARRGCQDRGQGHQHRPGPAILLAPVEEVPSRRRTASRPLSRSSSGGSGPAGRPGSTTDCERPGPRPRREVQNRSGAWRHASPANAVSGRQLAKRGVFRIQWLP